MNEELFPVELVKSPRLLWIEKHQVRTHAIPERNMPMAEDEGIAKWSACFGPREIYQVIEDDGDGAVGFGHTEDEAIRDLACKYGTPLWNEETP